MTISMTQTMNTKVKTFGYFFKEKPVAALGAVSKVLEYAERINSGLKTLRLYTREDVICKQLCSGPGALDKEKLFLYQQKLYSDEESIINVANGGLDYRGLEEFLEVLKTDKKLQERIIPTQRGIVCMGMSRASRALRKYPKEITAEELHRIEKWNLESFFLVRNGNNIYYIFTDYSVRAQRLFPTYREMDSLFKGSDGSTVTPEDLNYNIQYDSHKRSQIF